MNTLEWRGPGPEPWGPWFWPITEWQHRKAWGAPAGERDRIRRVKDEIMWWKANAVTVNLFPAFDPLGEVAS